MAMYLSSCHVLDMDSINYSNSSVLRLQVDFEAIVTAISAQKIHLSPPAAGWTPPGLPYAKPALADLSRSLQVTSSGLVPSGVLARLEAHQQACEAVTTALRGPNSNILQSPFLTVAVLPAFSAAFFEGVSDLKLQRFSALRAKLHVAILPAIYKEAVDAAWPAILQALDHARGEQAVSTHMHHVPYLVLAHKVADLLAQELVVRLKSVEKLKVNAGAPHVWLQENSMSKAIRGMVVSERDGILSAKTTVESIDSMIAR